MDARRNEGPDYSIVVPAFNEERLLPSTLKALALAMESIPYEGEVVVCDNNSTDRTAEIAREAGVPIIENPPLARSLYKACRVGAEVPLSLYKAVAELLAFVYRQREQSTTGGAR